MANSSRVPWPSWDRLKLHFESFSVQDFLALRARTCSIRARRSGVSNGPKSSVSYTWRISISESPSIGFGQRFTHSIASSFDFTCHSQ